MSRKLKITTHKTSRLILCLILLGSWGLLHIDLEGKSLWTDELFTAEWAGLSLESLMQETMGDYHPPLYFLMVNLWGRIAGHSDFALRWPSVIAGWISMAVIYYLGRAWQSRQTGWASAALWGTSPVVILYSRMARYYSLAALISLLSTALLSRALTHNKKHLWAAYILFSSMALYTFYLTGFILVAHIGLLLWHKRKDKFQPWLAAIFLTALTMLPWASVILNQAVRTGRGAADLTYSITGFILKLAYPTYATALGESIFPWHPLAFLGGLAVITLFTLGCSQWKKQRRLLLLLGLSLMPLFGMILVTTLISPRTPFVSIPARTLFTIPYIFLIIGSGLTSAKIQLKLPATLLMIAAWILSLSNYYTNQQFLNPIYLTPAREIAEQILNHIQPRDAIFSPADSGLYYYYEQTKAPQPHFTQENNTLAYLKVNPESRIWMLTLGRDQTRYNTPTELQTWLQTHYRAVDAWGYVPQAPLYRSIKSRLLGREAYQYRALLQLYTHR